MDKEKSRREVEVGKMQNVLSNPTRRVRSSEAQATRDFPAIVCRRQVE